ncbi:DNA translocase FtsK 4TM domain-containing protein [Marinobacterium sp. AK62]|uniref:DNA translocase FtsK n=2 Tax=Marinobacterium alkalitolerans TaxID=1542925 RepID=A0ABS3ZCX2_9GAMM|nr:DNA translocase FtsK [Marinobacterium alkalitolerans]MBP0049170.1 DNA translocase FtsK 4TM domain-containing protein [Marinobacterium alkalitolerans]
MNIAREGSLIVLVGANLFLLLALLGYDPRDPGWSHLAYQPDIQNFTGAAGAWLADGAISALGIGAYLLPPFLVVPIWRFIRRCQVGLLDGVPFAMLRTLGAVLTLFSLCALASIHLSNEGLHYPFTVGGLVGEALSDWSVSWFSVAGSSVLLWTTLLLGLTLFLEVSWRDALERIGAGILKGYEALTERVQRTPRVQTEPATDTWQDAPVDEPEPELFTKREPTLSDTPVTDSDQPVSFDVASAPAEAERFDQALAEASETAASGTVEAERPRPEVKFEKQASSDEPPLTPEARKSLKIVPLSQTHQPLAEENEPEPTHKRQQLPKLPSLELLDPPSLQQEPGYSEDDLEQMSRLLEVKLNDFGVKAEVVEVNPGPVITRFELQPAPGVKASKISNLSRDLARSMAVTSVRVVEVIPGKSVVGVEIPNEVRQTVQLSEVLNAKPYLEASSRLTLALGNDIAGNPVVANLAKMPHLLVAGTTGSGKSVGVNAMLLSLLLKATPEEVRLILVDPKMLELSIYEGIPHLLTPVITDMKEAAGGLRWCVAEMERRYRLMAKMGVRNISGFNDKVVAAQERGEPIPDPLWKPEEHGYPEGEPAPALEALPYIVVVIDEFADMMMMVGKKVEELIARIAQKARAAGIHLILATQRPSVDVITGLIKANIPTRIAFQVSSKIDSRTILDQGGAESLLGYGDMLYVPAGTSIPNRVHGAFVSDDEVHRVVEQWKLLGTPNYIEEILSDGGSDAGTAGNLFDDEQDPLYDEAVAFVTESRKASISSVQRKLKIGYNRAARMIESMEAAGVVSEAGSNGQREVLAPPPPRD